MNSKLLNGTEVQVLGSVFTSIQNNHVMTKAIFSVRTEWNGRFTAVSSCKDFRIRNQSMEGKNDYAIIHDFPNQFSVEGKRPTVCEGCMASLRVCITQTIIAHATAIGIEFDEVRIDMEDNVDLRGFSGLSKGMRPGAQQFRINMHIESPSASKDQLNELYEIGKELSPAVDTMTNGTFLVIVK
jgi:hypothetical protein